MVAACTSLDAYFIGRNCVLPQHIIEFLWADSLDVRYFCEKQLAQQLFQHFDGCGFPETMLRYHDIGDIVEHERVERHIRDILVFAVTVSPVVKANMIYRLLPQP